MLNNRKKFVLILLLIGFLLIGALYKRFLFVPKTIRINEAEQMNKVILEINTASGDAGWNQVMNELEQRFEKENADIDIVFNRDKVAGLYDESLTILDSQGKLGDIIEVRSWDFLTADRLGVLPDSFRDIVLDVYEYEGHVYGLRMSRNSVGMIYNRKIFESLGLSEPVVYDDFLEICHTLKERGYTPIALGGGDLWHLQFLLDSYYYKDVLLKNMNWDAQLADGITSWKDKEIVQMFEDLKELVDKGFIENSWSIDSDSMMSSKLASGKAVMVCTGPWVISSIIEQNSDIELGWFYIPDERGMTIARDSGTSYWSITKECEEDEKKKEAAVRFLEYVYSSEIDQYISQKMGNISTARGGRDYNLTPIQKELWEDYGKASWSTKKGINDSCMPNGFRQYALTLTKKYLMGSNTLEQTIVQLQEAYDKCLNTE